MAQSASNTQQREAVERMTAQMEMVTRQSADVMRQMAEMVTAINLLQVEVKRVVDASEEANRTLRGHNGTPGLISDIRVLSGRVEELAVKVDCLYGEKLPEQVHALATSSDNLSKTVDGLVKEKLPDRVVSLEDTRKKNGVFGYAVILLIAGEIVTRMMPYLGMLFNSKP